MNVKLTGCLRYIQAVLEELLDSEQRFVVEGLNAVLLEHFLEEGFAQGGRQVVDKTRDTEVVVAYDVLVGVEYLSYFQGGLRLLEGARQVLYADNGRAYADIHLGEELAGKCVRDRTRQLLQVADVDVVLDLLDEDDVGFGDIEYEILVLVREQVLDNVVGGNVVGGNYADEEHDSADIGVEVQLACLEADFAREHVVQDYVLDEVVAVVLLVVVLLDTGERYRDNAGVLSGRLVGALHEYRIVRLNMDTKRLVGVSVADKHLVGVAQFNGEEIIPSAYSCEIAASDDGAVFVDYADNAVNCVLHLVDDTLEKSV